jgi:membrane associated rhomboid family serine protease
VIPLHDDNPTRRLPLATVAIIGVNVAVFAFALLLPRYGLTLGGFYARAGVTPFELTHGVDVAPPDLVPWWATIFSSMFIHGGWLHITFNMLFLWVFGNNVEDAMTRPRFLAFYLICGMVATATQVMTAPDSTAPLIGASGAIAGVLGAYLVLFPRARVLTVIPLFFIFPVLYVPAWILLLIWFAVQAVQGVTTLDSPDAGVAFFAHVGGFVAGLTLVFLFVDRRRRRPSRVRLGRPPV